jgi:hypothetical protein
MIGRRARVPTRRVPRWAAAATLIAVLGLGAILSQRSPDPLVADPAAAAAARASLETALRDARQALDELASALDAALAAGRTGAALTVAGDGNPGSHLTAAADALAGGDDLARTARTALAAVAGQLAVLQPTTAPPGFDVAAGAVSATAGQLAGAADAADAFRAMRRASQACLTDLGTALAALDRNDPVTALAALDVADQELAAVQAWRGNLDTLPIWSDTTGRLLSAARRVAVATRDGDAAARKAAAADYASAAADARQADLALAIAVAEGGSAVSAAPLHALADIRAAVEATLRDLDTITV